MIRILFEYVITNESVPTYAHLLRTSPSTPTGLLAAASPSPGEAPSVPTGQTMPVVHVLNNTDAEAGAEAPAEVPAEVPVVAGLAPSAAPPHGRQLTGYAMFDVASNVEINGNTYSMELEAAVDALCKDEADLYGAISTWNMDGVTSLRGLMSPHYSGGSYSYNARPHMATCNAQLSGIGNLDTSSVKDMS